MSSSACCYLITESSFVFTTPLFLVQQPSDAISLWEQVDGVTLKLAISK